MKCFLLNKGHKLQSVLSRIHHASMCSCVIMHADLAASRSEAELRVVGVNLFVYDVVSSNLLLQISHTRAKLLHIHQFLKAQTPEESSSWKCSDEISKDRSDRVRPVNQSALLGRFITVQTGAKRRNKCI